MGIDQFPSPFKVKPLIQKQKLETPVQSEIHTPSKSKVIENSRTISIEHGNRLEDLLSWIDDLDSRMKRTLSRQYLESIELKNQTNIEDLREKYRQVPFDDSFRKLSSILKKGNEVHSDGQASYGASGGKLSTDNEDDEMDFSEDVEAKENSEVGSEEGLGDDIIEIISSEGEEASDSRNVSDNYEENEENGEEPPGLDSLRTQGVTYHIKNGRPRLLDNYININNNEQSENSEYASEYSNGNDDGIDIEETNEDAYEDNDDNEHEFEDEYEEEHGKRYNQDDSDDEIMILDSDEKNNTQINKEKSFETGSNPASVNFDEGLDSEIQEHLINEVDDDDNQGEDDDEDENEHQEYVYPNNILEDNSSISLVYSNKVEPMNASKVIDEKNLFQSDDLMGLAEAVLKESNEMTVENSSMTARNSNTLYQDDKSGTPQYSTNINSGYTADYDSTDVNYQAGNLSGIEEESKEITDPVSRMHESFFKENSSSDDSIQLIDDFENISEGSLADEERDYEDSSNNDKGSTLNKHEICEQMGSTEIEEENNEDNYSILVEHVNHVPIFKTVTEEDPETVLFKLKETEEKFNIRLNSIKCLEDEIILKYGHLPESYTPNQFVEEDKNDINNNVIYGKGEVVDYGSIHKPIPKPLLQDLSVLDETSFFETMNNGDDNEASIYLPVLKLPDDNKTFIGETSIMDDNDLKNGAKTEETPGPILGQIGLDQSHNTSVNYMEESRHEVFHVPILDSIDGDTSEVKDLTNSVHHDVRQHNTEGDEISHVRGAFLNQMNNKEHIDVPTLELIDADQSRIYNTTVNEMEIELNEDRTNDIVEETESSKSNSNGRIHNKTEEDKRSINALEQIDVDQSRMDDTMMNETVKEKHESIRAPALEQVEPDQSRIVDTTMNETVEENNESIRAPSLEQAETDQSRIDDTTMNETVKEKHESIRAPALEQVEPDQSRIDDTTMNETVEENNESIRAPSLEQVETDQSRIDDTTMNETVKEKRESIRAPALEQVEPDQSRIDDTTMNETVEENNESIRMPKLKQIDAEHSDVADTTIIEIDIELDDNISNNRLAPSIEQIGSDESIVDPSHEMADDNRGLLNSPNCAVIERRKSSLATDEIQEVEDKFIPEVTENIHEKSISEMLYPSITQELDDIHEQNDEYKIDIETTNANNEIINKNIDTEYESYIEEKNTLNQIPINIDENNIDFNEDVEFDTSDEYENKQSLSSEQIIEEPPEVDENIIFEYEQTTYVNVMSDGILHPSYIMEPIEEQEETQLRDYSEQLEIITSTSAIDDMEILEPSAIIEPNDTETDRVELINSAFEQHYEIIEPTDVLEPPSRSETPKLSRTHRESINAEEIFDNGSSEESRKRGRESEGFVRSKLRKLIYKPFQWLSKNRKSYPIFPSHIEAPKLTPLGDSTSKSSLNKKTLKPFKEDADIKADDSMNMNDKKYYELMRHLKRSIDSRFNEIKKDRTYNILNHEKEENNSDGQMVDDEDKPDYSTMKKSEPNIDAKTKVEEKTLEDETLEQSINENHVKNNMRNVASNSDNNLPFAQLEINDSARNLKSTKQRSTSAKSRRPRKVLGLDMSEAHIEPVRSLRSGHKYGPEENDHGQTSDLLSSPKKTSRSNKELPKLRINKRRHLSNTKALDNSSPIEMDSKQSLPSSRKSSGSKWVESLLDHPALRTRSKSPLKRSIYQISSDLEEDSNLPRRSRRLRCHNEKLNDDAAHENENTEAEEEVKRGRPTKRH